MKRKRTLIFCFILITISLSAYNIKHNGIYYTSYSNSYPFTAIVNSGTIKYSGSVTIPDTIHVFGVTYTITGISNTAFSYCPDLISVSIPNTLETIEDDTFANCTGLASITIPNSVTKIGWNVFYNCGNLKTVNLGASVASIGWYTFSFCSSLTEINVDENNQNYYSKNGVLFNKDMTTLINCPNGLSDQFIMPNTVTTVRNYAFADCTKLTSIIMSENLNWIMDDAFVRCSKLTSVSLPDSLYHIGYNAFGECTSLTSITIPRSVYSISNKVFDGCTNLMAIHARSPIPCIFWETTFQNVFYGMNTNTCVLYVPLGSKSAYENAPQWWLFLNIVEETTDIKQISPSLSGIYIQDNMINFRNLIVGELIQIYTQDGKLVFHEKAKEEFYGIQLPKNKLYIIKIGEKCTKIIL